MVIDDTPLHIVCWHRFIKIDIVRILINLCANVNIENNYHDTQYSNTCDVNIANVVGETALDLVKYHTNF